MTTDSRRKDDTRAATALKWPEACSICAGSGSAFGKTCVCRVAPIAQPTPSNSASVDTATDLSKRLRNWDINSVATIVASDLHAAAAEIERYYGGMLAWKRTAEAKDKDFAAQVAGVRKDAERYRYLRDQPWSFGSAEFAQIIQLQQNALWDAAIDAAMSTHSPATGDDEEAEPPESDECKWCHGIGQVEGQGRYPDIDPPIINCRECNGTGKA